MLIWNWHSQTPARSASLMLAAAGAGACGAGLSEGAACWGARGAGSASFLEGQRLEQAARPGSSSRQNVVRKRGVNGICALYQNPVKRRPRSL